MIKMKTYFLAHPKNISELVREWELEFEEKTGIQLTNPFYDLKNCEKHDPKRVLSILKSIEGHKYGMVAVIGGGDVCGTYFDMSHAKQHGLPIYSIILNGRHNHPYLKWYSEKVFTNTNAFEKYIVKVK